MPIISCAIRTPPWLVIRAPGAADDGLFARNAAGEPLVLEGSGSLASGLAAGVPACLVGEATLPDGRRAVPVFQLIAERYLDERFTPEEAAETCGVPAATIRRLAAEIARAAFEEEIELAQPWTDWAGRRHETMSGRPVSFHAMRGISAHSNGFQTCRAMHLLQLLLGTIDVPGGWRYKSPHPKPCPPGPKPAGRPEEIARERPLPGGPLGYPTSPEDLIVDSDGRPGRIDKAFSWEAPFAVHGMMHMVIANAAKGDPYPIDTLFLYMANMAWNSAMNSAETMRMLTDKDQATGRYRIPRIIYSDAYYSEMVAFADLVLPDTTYFERWDCISLLDRPIGDVDGPADVDPSADPKARPRRAAVPGRADRARRAARPAGFVTPDGKPRYPGLYADYLVNHERRPGIGPLGGWRGAAGDRLRPRRAEPAPARALCRERLLLEASAAGGAALFQTRQQAYLEPRSRWACSMPPSRSCCSFMSSRCSVSGSPPRDTAIAAAGRASRARRDLFRSAAVLVQAARGGPHRPRDVRPPRADPAADGDVSLLGLAERLAAADPRLQPSAFAPGARAEARARRRTTGSGCRAITPGSGSRPS